MALLGKLADRVKARRVPSTRLGRLWEFSGLAAGLSIGATAETIRRFVNPEKQSSSHSVLLSESVFMTEANIDRRTHLLSRIFFTSSGFTLLIV